MAFALSLKSPFVFNVYRPIAYGLGFRSFCLFKIRLCSDVPPVLVFGFVPISFPFSDMSHSRGQEHVAKLGPGARLRSSQGSPQPSTSTGVTKHGTNRGKVKHSVSFPGPGSTRLAQESVGGDRHHSPIYSPSPAQAAAGVVGTPFPPGPVVSASSVTGGGIVGFENFPASVSSTK